MGTGGIWELCFPLSVVVYLKKKKKNGIDCNSINLKRHRFDPWIRKTPWRKKRYPTLIKFLENPMDRGAWSLWGGKELERIERLNNNRYV